MRRTCFQNPFAVSVLRVQCIIPQARAGIELTITNQHILAQSYVVSDSSQVICSIFLKLQAHPFERAKCFAKNEQVIHTAMQTQTAAKSNFKIHSQATATIADN